MENFDYYAPTRVVFGKDSESRLGELIKEQNCKKVLLHYGGKSAEKSGLLDKVRTVLKDSGIEYISLGGVVPNPRLSLVYKGIEMSKEAGVDFILAVGGGSVIDSAKAIGYGLYNDFDVWDIYDWKEKPKGSIPVGCVLTISAAGSEMSDSSVISNDMVDGGFIKRGVNSPYGRCKFAVLNPELTYSLPEYQTSCGVTDIIMHTLERYFAPVQTMQMTDGIAEALIRVAIDNGRILMKEPENYDARAEIMWAGSLSHNGITGCGNAGGDWATHQLEHELSGMFDVAHGAGLAAVWGSWARYVYKENPARFACLAGSVFGIKEDTDEQSALKGIEAMEKVFSDLNMPLNIHDLIGREVTDAEIAEMSKKCAHHDRKIGGFKKLDINDMENIYRMAK